MKEVVFIRKTIELMTPIGSKQKAVVKQLNDVIGDVVRFKIFQDKDEKYKLSITVYEENLKAKSGRPQEHKLDFQLINAMKKSGKTNKEIYEKLGISRSLFYLRMREYKNNIGH